MCPAPRGTPGICRAEVARCEDSAEAGLIQALARLLTAVTIY